MTRRLPFFATYSQYRPVTAACEKGAFFQLNMLFFLSKWYTKGKGLDLVREPPHIKTIEPVHWLIITLI